jgi:hypothetical protein
MSLAPEVATITGSSTMFLALCRRRLSATTAMVSGCDSIPIFTAPTLRSSKTASICAAMKSGGTSWMPVTPRVFCAVSAVMAEAP